MRVVHLINGLGIGGGERLLADLLTRLSGDCQSVVYCLTRTGTVARELRENGISVRSLSWEGVPNPIGWLRFARDVARADLLHTHFFYSDLIGSVLGRVLRVRRRLSTRHEMGTWMRAPHRWLEPWVYRGAEVLCVSRAVRDSLRSRGLSPERLRVVHSGIELPPEKDGPRERVVISVGRLESIKGHDILLRGFAATRALDGWRLVLVGDGAERARLGALAEALVIADRCELCGEQSPARVRELLSSAAIYVQPSRSEALGLALLEAMASGCACVASAVGGVPEIVTHLENGVLVDAGDLEQLATALDQLATDDALRQRLARAARERVATGFSIESFVRGVEEIYGVSAG